MARLLLSILLVLVGTNVYAQSPVEVKTNDGRIVILKSDGTWEYKKDAPQPSPSPATNPVRSNIGTDSLPPDFAGHDAKTLFTQLSDLKRRLVKSEFETTAEYEKRVAREKQKPILGNLTVRDTFSLLVTKFEAGYDADAQKMRFFLAVEKNPMAELMKDSALGRESLEYSNRYSIQWPDERGYGSQGIFFDELGSLVLAEKGYQQGFLAEVNLSVEEARRLKNTSKAVA